MNFFRWMNNFSSYRTDQLSWFLFQCGLFCLPSSALLAGFFFLFPLVLGIPKQLSLCTKDFWNFPFLLASILMVLGSINAYSGWLAWVGLANWLPFFLIFISFQLYLQSPETRKRSALCLLAGTLPVVVTGLGQMWLGWEGPWQLMNGLIVWFVSPGGNPLGRLSGLFDYANIAGSWLVVIWPFSIAALLQPFLRGFIRVFLFIFSSSIASALIMTESRNAWGGLFLSIPLMFGPTRWFWLLPLLTFALVPIALSVLPNVDLNIQLLARKIVPKDLWSRLSDLRYADSRELASTRLSQWQVAVDFIRQKPWLGWGAASFSVLYPLVKGLWHGHTHNLPLELAVSHGLIVAILLVGFVLSLLIVSFKLVFLKSFTQQMNSATNLLFDRAWWTATFILVFLHASDIPLFDSRLNILGWILLAGLRSMISTKTRDFMSDRLC